MINKHCEWCDHSFKTNAAHQIYCSVECREAATKDKIAKNYFAKQVKKRFANPKPCKSCGKPLSAYNTNQICFGCITNPTEVAKALKEMKGIADEPEQD